MSDIDRVIKLNMLIAKMSAVMVRVKGMEAFNQSRVSRGESAGYSEYDFENSAKEIDLIAQTMENLYHTGN